MTNETISEVYVLWHPGFANGEALAQHIYRWVRPNGLGPQVFYRSAPSPEAPPNGLPPPLPQDCRQGFSSQSLARYPPSSLNNLQVVVVLIDAHLIADPAWRHWINGLGEGASDANRVILPVALDATAYNVPPALQELNFLRPAGIPPMEEPTVWDEKVLEGVSRSLLKQLTETLCDLMLQLEEGADTGSPLESSRSKVKIFLSHAKADGTEPAKRIRDYIYSQTQIAAFFDENDIPFGSLFSKVLERNVTGTCQAAALIAVRSARYADRPWCRRELSRFRRPRQDDASPRKTQFWTLNPTLVVDALEDGTQTFCIPEVGNATTIRWSLSVPQQEEQIVTTVLRDVLLASHHRALGRRMPDGEDCIVLNWLPDPGSLMYIPAIRSDAKVRVFYPGRDLSGPELKTLAEFFPQVRFISFDRISP